MLRTLLLGAVASLLAIVVWVVTSWLNVGPVNGLLGVGAGLALGLIRDHSPLARYGAFLVGLALGILALIAGLAGFAGFVVIVGIYTLISALTGGRLPLWAMLLGGGILAAMYEPLLISSGWYILTQYPTALFVALATSAGGFIVAVFVELIEVREEERDEQRREAELPMIDTSGVKSMGGAN